MMIKCPFLFMLLSGVLGDKAPGDNVPGNMRCRGTHNNAVHVDLGVKNTQIIES